MIQHKKTTWEPQRGVLSKTWQFKSQSPKSLHFLLPFITSSKMYHISKTHPGQGADKKACKAFTSCKIFEKLQVDREQSEVKDMADDMTPKRSSLGIRRVTCPNEQPSQQLNTMEAVSPVGWLLLPLVPEALNVWKQQWEPEDYRDSFEVLLRAKLDLRWRCFGGLMKTSFDSTEQRYD